MTTTEELELFHQFAVGQLSSGGSDPSLEELLVQWRGIIEREDANAGIRRGLKAVEEGRHQPADDVLAEARQRLES